MSARERIMALFDAHNVCTLIPCKLLLHSAMIFSPAEDARDVDNSRHGIANGKYAIAL
jgi:hypothetical protein